MNEITLDVIANILEGFDMHEMYSLFSDQIENPDEDYVSPVMDHFQSLYKNYAILANGVSESVDDTDLKEAKNRFYRICRMICKLISEKFGFDLDDDYLDESQTRTVGITSALYTFFIVDYYSISYELVRNYLVENMFDIYEKFPEVNEKDLPKREVGLSKEMIAIIINIHDVSDYIFSVMDVETFLDTLDDGYIPADIIKGLYEVNAMMGDFTRIIADIYKTNIPIKAKLAMQIYYNIMNGNIPDLFKMTSKEN